MKKTGHTWLGRYKNENWISLACEVRFFLFLIIGTSGNGKNILANVEIYGFIADNAIYYGVDPYNI